MNMPAWISCRISDLYGEYIQSILISRGGTMNKKSLFFGILVGSLAGAAVTLLNAPRSGKDTRKKLSEFTSAIKESSDDLKNDFNQIKQSITSLTEEGKQTIDQLSEDLKTSFELWQESIEPNKQALQSEIGELKRTIEELETNVASGQPK
ncbi:MAG TPA: YtxH domain-containing protein [Chondromyces sp.]|nr:YtxH domain-containing protein [Chondromyces sp.]